MKALTEIKSRFSAALAELVEDPQPLLSMIRPAQDSRFGDYQANCAMPLSKRLDKPSREVANDLIGRIALDDLCKNVEVAGPGFINLTLDDEWLKQQLAAASSSDRLGVELASDPKTYVIDFSSPNVAKPMHVGHIRSTVIGDAITKILKFVGHRAFGDNHLGDWGTQFGMIIYGYKHFVQPAEYQSNPIGELSRLYKLVRKLMDYHAAVRKIPEVMELLEKQRTALERLQSQQPTGDKATDKKTRKDIGRLNDKIKEQESLLTSLKHSVEQIESDSETVALAKGHPDIETAVLEETARLHEGDEENRQLWNEFLPHCRADMQRIYDRLNIEFDYELGESSYHSMLGEVVTDFLAKGLARESEGAICVFLDNYETPMIIQKKDGAFLYATSDLATIKYRVDNMNADAMLYVVDHRQGEHFDKLFDAARLWGFNNVEMKHVSFGTVLGDDRKPFKTRSGDTVGLEGLLDESESRALKIAREQNAELDEERLQNIAKVVGIGALKYADLSQNRSSDYKFDYDKMLALRGNTATYLQYSYARVQGIIRKVGANISELRRQPGNFLFEEPIERQLGVALVRFGETLDECLVDYKPNLLCNYLFDLTQTFFTFYEKCSVKDAGSEELKNSRLQLCDLTARTIKTGLSLLGIGVLDQM